MCSAPRNIAEKSAENLTKQQEKIPAVTQPSCTSNGEVPLARVRSSLDDGISRQKCTKSDTTKNSNHIYSRTTKTSREKIAHQNTGIRQQQPPPPTKLHLQSQQIKNKNKNIIWAPKTPNVSYPAPRKQATQHANNLKKKMTWCKTRNYRAVKRKAREPSTETKQRKWNERAKLHLPSDVMLHKALPANELQMNSHQKRTSKKK
jgi:hypothetical protein